MNRRGMSILEVLIAAVIISTAIFAYLSLAAQETRWTKDIDDRAKALALAENMLLLTEFDWHDQFRRLPKEKNGAHVLDEAHKKLPDASVALGTTLFDWVAEKQKDGGFGVTMVFNPTPTDMTGTPVTTVGKMSCKVSWLGEGGKAKWIELHSVVPQ